MEEEIKSIFGDAFHNGKVGNFKNTLLSKVGKPQDVNHVIELPLEKLYNGTTINIRADKKYLCKACVKGWKRQKCSICKGVGKVTAGLQCCMCHGHGFQQMACDRCKGNLVIREEKYLTVEVPAGTVNGGKIRLRGEGDSLLHLPEAASDIVCTIKEKPHAKFRRCGADLYILWTISLVQALCGFKAVIEHLDGRRVVLHAPRGTVIKPGDMYYAKKEGMPMLKSSSGTKGDLVVVFNVCFPSKVPSSLQLKELEALLPPRPHSGNAQADMEEYELMVFDPLEQVYHVPTKAPYADEQSPMKPPKLAKECSPKCAQQ